MQTNSLFLGEFTRKELGESIANGTIKGALYRPALWNNIRII
jgi:hypothetical protein